MPVSCCKANLPLLRKRSVEDFSAGSGIVELVNTFHYGENQGTVPVDLVMFYAGGADLPLSVKR